MARVIVPSDDRARLLFSTVADAEVVAAAAIGTTRIAAAAVQRA